MKRSHTIHETLQREDLINGPSERQFGVTLTVILAIVGLLPLWWSGSVRPWALIVAATSGVLVLVWPEALRPLNRGWRQIGRGFRFVFNPIVMAFLFFGVVTPFGAISRLLGKAGMRKSQPDRSAATYWIARDGQSRMDRQF
jgi:hypothetical protein